jgi:hypothetical protein
VQTIVIPPFLLARGNSRIIVDRVRAISGPAVTQCARTSGDQLLYIVEAAQLLGA